MRSKARIADQVDRETHITPEALEWRNKQKSRQKGGEKMPQWSEDREKIYQGGCDIVDLIDILIKIIKKQQGFNIAQLIDEGMDLTNLVDHAKSYPEDQLGKYMSSILAAAGEEFEWRHNKPTKPIPA